MHDDDDRFTALTEVFASGRRLAEELHEENLRLRARIAQLEAAIERSSSSETGALALTAATERQTNSEIPEPVVKLAELELHHQELLQDHADLERQNSNYLSLYVASSQIHATLVFEEVLRNIKEILINLVGADIFAIYVYEDSGRRFRRAALDGNLDPADEIIPFGDNLVSQIVRSGSLCLQVPDADLPSGQQPIAILPLMIGSQPIGVVIVFRLLVQKETFDAFDLELFDLLAAHAATALMSSFKYQRLERKVLTLQGLLDLFKTGVSDDDR